MTEGNIYSNLLKMIKNQGYNKDSSMTFGKVLSISPLKIKVNGLEIEEGDFMIVESLTEHKRNTQISVKSLTGNTGVSSSHSHTLIPFEITDAEITYESPLEVDDLVLVFIDEGNFFIIDRVVIT